MKQLSITSILMAFSAYSFAQNAPIAATTAIDGEQPLNLTTPPDKIATQETIIAAEDAPRQEISSPRAIEPSAVQPQQRVVTLEELQSDASLTENMLNQAMIRQQWSQAAELLDIYRKFPEADPILVKYTEGALLRLQRKHKQAIDIYRSIIADDPSLDRVRLDLAIMLFEDKQYIAARDQFQRVRSSTAMQEDIPLIEQYLERIRKEDGWNFDAGVSYMQDDNINNASASKTITIGEKVLQKKEESLPQSARGIRYNASAGRDFNINGSHYFNVDTSINGRKTFNQSEFDDVNLRLYSGYHYQDANYDFKIRPTLATRYIGGKHYSNTAGLALQAGYWVNPQFRLTGSLSAEHEKTLKTQSSSNDYFLGIGGLYANSAARYFFGGINIGHEKEIGSRTGSSVSFGGRIGWGQDWPYGISTRLSGNYTHKAYLAHNPLFNRTRKDNIYGAQLAIWNRDWHFWGITPKLNFSTNTVNSNIADLYSYDKQNIFLQFDKTF